MWCCWEIGRAEGEAEGKLEGRLALRQGVLAVLAARGLSTTEAANHRILASTDVAQLEGWLRHAATAASIDDVFG